MSEHEAIKLEPCPFCGGANVSVVEGETFRWRFAKCNECGAQAPDVRIQTLGDGTKEEWEADAHRRAIVEWNTRADRDRLAAEVEALRKDAWRLDWLENRIAEEGELHLHDGNHPRGMGLGLFFGKLNQRTLRQAIDVAMPPTASPEEGTS
jgi:Lar family restriction alleviation protein